MKNEELAPHINDITRALKGKISKEEVERELQDWLDNYKVDLATAKRSVVNKLGGDPQDLFARTEKKVNEITGTERNLELKARIVSINEKNIEVDGVPKKIHYGIFGDDTGTIPFTLWEPLTEPLEKGDTVHVINVYATTWNDKPQINLGSRGRMKMLEEDEVPEFKRTLQRCNIIDVRESMNNLIVTGRILSMENKIVQTENGEKDLYSGVLADETGKIQFSAWYDFDLEEGQVIEVQGGYIRSWRGIPQLSFDDNASVETLEDDSLPPKDELEDLGIMTISQLARRGGAVDAIIDAVMIDIKSGSGLIFRCPECNRVVQKSACRIHGKVDGEPDLRVKGILDDGTGALTVIITRDETEKILGYDLDKAMEIARDRMDHGVIKDELEDHLIAQPLRMKGNVTCDDYGLMLIASEVKEKKINMEEEARKLLDEVRV
ncbi:MAG: DNA-binding protein [Thermoplasmata archaeon]